MTTVTLNDKRFSSKPATQLKGMLNRGQATPAEVIAYIDLREAAAPQLNKPLPDSYAALRATLQGNAPAKAKSKTKTTNKQVVVDDRTQRVNSVLTDLADYVVANNVQLDKATLRSLARMLAAYQ